VVDRIEYFKRVLGDKSASRDDRIEALKFIVHFVGDVHQPFHAIGEAKGGNGVHVIEFGSDRCGRYPCNLHSAWDSGLIEHTGMDEEGYVAHLEQLISREHLRASGNPADWANESFALAKTAWVNDGGFGGRAVLPAADQSRGRAVGTGGSAAGCCIERGSGTCRRRSSATEARREYDLP